jgi:hypothetical protein
MKEIFENIGSPEFKNSLNSSYGSNSDIIKSLNSALPKAYKEVFLIAPYFKGRTPLETSYKIWYFLKNKIAYIKDRAGYQFVKLPRRMLDEKSADCKSKSLFTAAVLKQIYPEAKIYLRYASYSNINIPTHVYTLMILNDKTYLIDSVYKAFNEEKQFNYKNDYEMKIYTLSGFDDETINGRKERKAKRQERRETRQEKRQERRETRQEKRQQRKEDRKSGKKPGALKKVALAAPRAAFLGILALNVKGLATKLNKAISINPAKVQELWTKKLGGEFEQLKKVAEKGSTRKMIGYIPDYEKEDYNLGQRSILGEPVSTATAVATAAPVILAVVALLKQILPKKDYEESGNTRDIEDMSKKAPGADAGEDAGTDAGADAGADAEGGFFAKNKILIFGGAAALALFFIMKKK